MAAKKQVVRREVPYMTIQKLWLAGKTYTEIAKAIGRYKKDAKNEDLATKGTRAIVSNMLRGQCGAWEKNGKPCVLPPRQGMHNIGVGKKMHRSTAKASKKAITKKGGQ